MRSDAKKISDSTSRLEAEVQYQMQRERTDYNINFKIGRRATTSMISDAKKISDYISRLEAEVKYQMQKERNVRFQYQFRDWKSSNSINNIRCKPRSKPWVPVARQLVCLDATGEPWRLTNTPSVEYEIVLGFVTVVPNEIEAVEFKPCFVCQAIL